MTSLKSFVYVAALALIMSGSARAGLLGASVTGSLQFSGGPTNWFDPANLFVPVGPLNKTLGTTVPIGAALEFGFQDGSNTDTANFDDTTLTITDITGPGSNLAVYTFTSTAFAGLTLSKTSDNFANGLSASLIGNTLTVTQPTFVSAPGTFQAVFSLTSGAATPEPGSIALMTTGLGLLGLLVRRRQRG